MQTAEPEISYENDRATQKTLSGDYLQTPETSDEWQQCALPNCLLVCRKAF